MEKQIKVLIRETMIKDKITFSVLSKKTGMSRGTLGEYLTIEDRSMSLNKLLLILDTLNLTNVVFRDTSSMVRVIKKNQLQEKLREVEKLKQELGEL